MYYNIYVKKKSLTPFIWLSITAAIITIGLKTIAYYLTGSVGLLSDALESIVNLVAAVSALFLLRIAEKPPDEEHLYGHSKAEYFSSIIEAVLIILAAISICTSAVDRILYPKPIEFATTGLIVSAVASVINLIVATTLLRVGKKHNSVTLEADGHHLLTDVWTSVGVITGVAIVSITNVQILDPIIAIGVAINIVVIGFKLIKQSALGLMDTSLPDEDLKEINAILEPYKQQGITYHDLRTRQSANRSFMSVHILVPGAWSVQKGHDISEEIEKKLCEHFMQLTVITHIEPIEDPKSHDDIELVRKKA